MRNFRSDKNHKNLHIITDINNRQSPGPAMESRPHTSGLYFLSEGGELGELTRAYNWAATSLGPPQTWPASLRAMLGIVLHSASPMVLFWGDDLICFYNDAYRPTLGQDRHPAVGKRAADIFPEAWESIRPILLGVKETGQPVWVRDLLIPVLRNGGMEDVYWTFSYSPAYDDNGSINGVFISCIETTEKVLQHKALSENDSLFRALSEGTDILIAAADQNGATTYYNRAWTQITGKSADELLFEHWSDKVHPDDRGHIVDSYRQAFENKETFIGEYRIRAADKGYRWILVTAPPRFAPDGSFAGYIAAGIDITSRKVAEEKFNISRERLNSVVESAPFPIAVYTGREMRIALANQALINVWGKGDDVIGKTYYEVLPELKDQGIYPILDRVYTSGTPFHARNQRVDLVMEEVMQTFYFNYSFTPLFDTNGKVYGVMNTAADVTDLNMATQQLARSNENFRNLIMHSPVAMCLMLGKEHVVEIANDAIVDLWGKPREEVMYRPIFDGLPDAREQGLEELLDHVYATGEAFRASEMPVQLFRFGKHETVYQDFVYEAYRDTNGAILGVLAITIDVTQQVLARQRIEDIVKERTAALEEANASLQRSNAELAQFAYIASHDLQEPLRKIRVFTQMLEGRISGTLDEQSATYLNKIKNASERMQGLIRDVLAYSGIVREADLFSKVNLESVVAECLTDFELLVDQKQAQVGVAGLPVIEAIPLQMSQLFGNLISNSLKFARTGMAVRISITARLLGDEEALAKGFSSGCHHIQYTDNGIGFRPEYAEKIFNIFQRLHAKSAYEGTGIGLAMCRKIAENHNGRLDADGSSENGAVFNLYLPV